MNTTNKSIANKEISKQITHFINTYCRESVSSFHDAYTKLIALHEQDKSAFDQMIRDHECPKKVS